SLADPADDQVLAEAAGVTFGLAEFIAAEEMGRTRGYWWAPDGSALLAARVDETPVNRWHIADPANPDRTPAEVAYPAAGTPNAAVSLLLARLDGTTVEVDTDRAAFPYLVTACWTGEHDPLVLVQRRDPRRRRLRPDGGVEVGTRAGGTTVVARRGLDEDGATVRVYRNGAAVASVASLAENPALPAPRPVLFGAGPREVRTAVLFPSWYEPGQ